jgi:hypothetical protein
VPSASLDAYWSAFLPVMVSTGFSAANGSGRLSPFL